jgi:hypothetical protein
MVEIELRVLKGWYLDRRTPEMAVMQVHHHISIIRILLIR